MIGEFGWSFAPVEAQTELGDTIIVHKDTRLFPTRLAACHYTKEKYPINNCVVFLAHRSQSGCNLLEVVMSNPENVDSVLYDDGKDGQRE